MIKRFAIAVHRWLGVALCLFFLLWFPSGIGMMYWDFPSVTAADRLDRSPSLDASLIRVSPAEAYQALGDTQPAADVRLSTFDGRPVYRFRVGRADRVVYADTGAQQGDVTKELMLRVASAWARLPASAATVAPVDVDQWTVEGSFRGLQPLWKFSWADGQHVYVSERSGEVAQYTTTASRLGAYLGPIPHWMYFTPLRKRQAAWSRLVIWTSGAGTATAMLGIAIGIWMYSPSKQYRHGGDTARIPYRGQKRWHMILGLIFGVGAATWAFSGMLSMDPFPATSAGRPAAAQRGAAAEIPQALAGRLRLADFGRKDPRDVLTQLAGASVKELALRSFAGEPVYLATLAGGETRIVPLDGPARDAFDSQRIMDLARTAAGAEGLADIRVIDRYDRYYVDRHHKKPLPVILARLNDAEHARYYIDPKTARLVSSYSSSGWVTRWLYHGLHSLDFPWLYDYRPAWDIVVIAFMLGGTALCVTSLILAWRVLGAKMPA